MCVPSMWRTAPSLGEKRGGGERKEGYTGGGGGGEGVGGIRERGYFTV